MVSLAFVNHFLFPSVFCSFWWILGTFWWTTWGVGSPLISLNTPSTRALFSHLLMCALRSPNLVKPPEMSFRKWYQYIFIKNYDTPCLLLWGFCRIWEKSLSWNTKTHHSGRNNAPEHLWRILSVWKHTFRSAILGSVLGAPLCLCLDLESSDCSKNHDPAGLLGCAFLAKSVTSNPFWRPDLVLAVFMHILIPWVCS